MRGFITLIARLIAAAAISAVAGAALMVGYDYLVGPQRFSFGPALGGLLLVSVFAFPFVLAGLALVGLPVSWLLARFRLDTLLSYAVAGLVCGTLVALLALADLPLAVAAMFGTIAAVTWRLIERPYTVQAREAVA